MRGCQRRMVVAFWLLAVRAVVRNSPFLTNITENKSRLRPRLTTLQGSDETNCFVAALFVWECSREQTRPRSASLQPLSALLSVPIDLTPSPSRPCFLSQSASLQPLSASPPTPLQGERGVICLVYSPLLTRRLVSWLTSSQLVHMSTSQLVNLFSTRSLLYSSAC